MMDHAVSAAASLKSIELDQQGIWPYIVLNHAALLAAARTLFPELHSILMGKR